MNSSEKYASSIVILVSLLMLWNQGTIAVDAERRVRVEIVANYTSSWSFGIHCESKNDDLGAHVIAKGSSYSFSFRPNVWRTTLFHCAVNFEGHGVSFAIFNAKRDTKQRCNSLCLWKVHQDGVLGYKQDTDIPDLFFPWTR